MIQQTLKEKILQIWNDQESETTIFDSIGAGLRWVGKAEDKFQAYHDVADTWEAAASETDHFPFALPVPYPLAWLSTVAQINEHQPLTQEELDAHKRVFIALGWYGLWKKMYNDDLTINEEAAHQFAQEILEKVQEMAKEKVDGEIKKEEPEEDSKKVIKIPFVTNTKYKS